MNWEAKVKRFIFYFIYIFRLLFSLCCGESLVPLIFHFVYQVCLVGAHFAGAY